MDQHLAQVFAAALRNAKQLRFPARGRLPRHEAQPGCEIASSGEGARIADGSHEGRGVQRPDAGDRKEAPGAILIPSGCDELRIESCNALASASSCRRMSSISA